MDKDVMLACVEKIHRPLIATAPETIISQLVLYSYQFQFNATMEDELIPSRCTSLCWPVNVRIDRSLKVIIH